jgi:hypothetical protein
MKTCRLARLFAFARPLFGIALLWILAVVTPLNAQGTATGTVSGRILNQGTGEYLRNAVVTVVGTPLAVTAEAGGNYSLTNVPAGTPSTRILRTTTRKFRGSRASVSAIRPSPRFVTTEMCASTTNSIPTSGSPLAQNTTGIMQNSTAGT